MFANDVFASHGKDDLFSEENILPSGFNSQHVVADYPNVLLLDFRPLGAVLGTGLLSVGNSCGIKRTSDDMVSCTGKVLYSTATDQYYAVFLKVVTFTGNVAGYFNTIGKTNSGDLTKS